MAPSYEVTVIGAGDMGHGFAAQFALHGHQVTLSDHKQSNLDRAESDIEEVVRFLDDEGMADRSPADTLRDISFTTDAPGGVEGADVVIETVPEELETKQAVFEEIVPHVSDDTVLSSNTSGIPITDIAAGTPERAGQFVGCHWWYPPYLLTPVEVIHGEQTEDWAFEKLETFVESVDRDPIEVKRDVPGFVWNRIQHALIRECVYLAKEDVASIEDINRAIRDGYATRTAAIGPFETMDIAGLDLVQTVSDDLFPHLCNADEADPIFDELIEEGRGGIEDGAGFLEYDAPPEAVRANRDEKVAAIRKSLSTDE
ncbi:3-hydroxyacyl-CoA dehydrogenase family protein [Halorubrum sp. CBA1125]|uniref:3-hydroxyacyl-CoA dehydrogenase family protein n=1 Tax=Halorubrum sp. CBA1125 TaxID=2668072 RepID=UPI0012E8C7DA|nr:3-hydroxyacyl-CoA dehydrogenase family protein [Halorubrum sp. CBA1125]MUW13382.1 3-hydroxyacyl-CoA dehydrogenase family protein [Halorubrum sp. CBA1125]